MNNMNRHFIFTSGRSGSNYLSNTLNLCPDCVNFGEVLGEWTLPYKTIGRFLCDDHGSERYLNYIYSSRAFFILAQLYSVYSHIKGGRKINYKKSDNIASIGVKDFLVTMERRAALDYLKNHKDIKVIYLYRKNLLKKYISGVYMKHSRVAASYHQMEISPVNIDIDDMLKQLDIYFNESMREKQFISALKEHSVFSISYEDYFESQESISEWNNKIFEYLNVTPVQTQSGQKKILPDMLKDAVSNSEEIIKAIEGTKFESFLY